MTLQDAVRELRAAYPGQNVAVTVSAFDFTHNDGVSIQVNLWVEHVGHAVWGATTIESAVMQLRAKITAPCGSDLDTSDAQLAAMTEPVHVG